MQRMATAEWLAAESFLNCSCSSAFRSMVSTSSFQNMGYLADALFHILAPGRNMSMKYWMRCGTGVSPSRQAAPGHDLCQQVDAVRDDAVDAPPDEAPHVLR